MSLELWAAFLVASFLISLSPGAGAVYAMSCGLANGFARGYLGSVGLVLGLWTALAVVALGLGAVVAASPLALALVKWVGVAYLLYLGVQQWRAPARPPVAEEGAAPADAWRLLVRGWAVNATNPKGLLFMLAVVPQFLEAGRPLATQYVVIGLTFAFTDLVVMAGYTWLAARVLRALRDEVLLRRVNRGFGGLFVGAAAWLAGSAR